MRRELTVAVVVGVLSTSFTIFGQAADPHAGTWKLNLTKSNITPGPPPQNQTATIESVENGLKSTVEAVNAKGQSTRTVVTAKFDGKEYPVEGTQIMRTYRRVDVRTYEQTNKVDGKVTTTAKVVISPDGKTRTMTSTTPNAQGKPVVSVMVYDKVE
jgi:hypothetical protein